MDNNLENAPVETGQAETQAVESQGMETSQEPNDGGEKMAGKFNSVEELEKAYLEAQKALTQSSQKAKKADELEGANRKLNTLVSKIAEEQGVTVDQVLSILNDVDDSGPTVDDKVAQLEKKLAERDFIDSHPDIKENLDIIRSVADAKGLTLEEALEEPSIKRIIELQSKPSRPSVVETTNKLARNDAGRAEKIQKVRKGELSTRDIGKMLLGSDK